MQECTSRKESVTMCLAKIISHMLRYPFAS